MARITSIEKIDKERNNKHGRIPATYCIFEKDGEKLFQIDTHGGPNREYVGQKSQTIQFDGKLAKELVSILIKEFW